MEGRHQYKDPFGSSPWSPTKRQRELIARVLEVKHNKAIADDMGITENTVKNMLTALYKRLGVDSRLSFGLRARDLLLEEQLGVGPHDYHWQAVVQCPHCQQHIICQGHIKVSINGGRRGE